MHKNTNNSIVPLVGEVVAGFPSPAEQYLESPLDLNRLLVYRPAATFFVRAQGDSMLGAGIHSGDILVVDRSLAPRDGAVVIASMAGDFTVKYFQHGKEGDVWLVAANPAFRPIHIVSMEDFNLFGVVTAVIHQFVKERRRPGGPEYGGAG